MRQTFLEAVRKLIYHTRTVDTIGFVSYIPQHLFEEVEYEFKAYCRKHGLRARAKQKPPAKDGKHGNA